MERAVETVKASAFSVFDELGPGYQESVYQAALVYELRQAGLDIQEFYSIPITYKNITVGRGIADIVVRGKNDMIVIEVKAGKASTLCQSGMDQAQSYVRCLQRTTKLQQITTMSLAFAQHGVAISVIDN